MSVFMLALCIQALQVLASLASLAFGAPLKSLLPPTRCPGSWLRPPERLHAAPHRRQEEPDGDRHHAAGVRRLHQRRHAAGHQPAAPGRAGGQRGHRHAAAGPGRHPGPGQQGGARGAGLAVSMV